MTNLEVNTGGRNLCFDYRNYRGETAKRRVRPAYVWFGATRYHPEAQWLLRAWDLDRNADRDFAIADMRDIRPLAPANPADKIAGAARLAIEEATSARKLWPPMNSAHEGFAVILEEFDELKAHVFTNQKRRDLAAMKKEAVQMAAMALCFIAEVCDEERGRR